MTNDNTIESRLNALEARLSSIEKKLFPAAEPKPPLPQAIKTPPSPATQEQASVSSSGGFLGIVAVICFVFAAGFIIKLAIDSGWLTPVRQIGLAITFGISLIVAGFQLLRTDKAYASLLPAAGVIILYLSVFAGHHFHHLYELNIALGLITGTSLLCLWIYSEIRNDLYPLVAAVGSYAAPMLLEVGSVSEFSLYYFTFCSICFSGLSIWTQSRTLPIAASYLAIFVTSIAGLTLQQPDVIVGVLALHFIIFSTGTYLYTRHSGNPLTETESWAFFPVLLFFYAAEYFFLNQISPEKAPWLSLAFAGFLIALYLSAKFTSSKNLGSTSVVSAFAAIVFLHSFYFVIMPEGLRSILFFVLVFGLAFFPRRLTTSGSFHIPAFAIGFILLLEFIRMTSHLLHENEMRWVAMSSLSVVSLFTLYVSKFDLLRTKTGTVVLATAHLLAIMSFYRFAYDYGSLAVSGLWLTYALALMAVGFTKRDKILTRSTMLPLACAAGKALLYDVSSAAAPVRIVCLLITGAALYGSGLLLRKIDTWK